MLRASTCEGEGVGSGFLVSATEIVTAAHVVEGAASVGVVQGDGTYTAEVVGLDAEKDVALLRVREPIPGHVFEMSGDMARPGAEVAAIGHPLGEPLTITNGSVSRTDKALWPQVQLDVSVSPGNSGGPVVSDDGAVVGVILAKDIEAEGLAYALRSDVLRPVVDGSETLPVADAADCANPLGPEEVEAAPLPDSSELDRAAARTLANYFGGINTGDYRLAYDQLSPGRRSAAGFQSFKEGVESSYDFDFRVADVTPNSDGAVVWLEFVSLQSPSMGPQGESCTEWSLDYKLVWGSGGRMFIDVAKPHGGDGHRPCP
jgi:serine protease Do